LGSARSEAGRRDRGHGGVLAKQSDRFGGGRGRSENEENKIKTTTKQKETT
jgi:hypothetical protein